jgi:hypothetical protein
MGLKYQKCKHQILWIMLILKVRKAGEHNNLQTDSRLNKPWAREKT